MPGRAGVPVLMEHGSLDNESARGHAVKHAKRTLAILTLALAGCQGPIVPTSPTPTLTTIHILVEPSVAPLLRELAINYRPAHMLIAWEIEAGDLTTLTGWLANGRAPFALTNYLSPDSALWATPIGQDGLAIIVNVNNPISGLSAEQLRGLFTGRTLNWRELGEPDSPVMPISRPDGSSSGTLFRRFVLGDQPVTGAAQLAVSDVAVINGVRADRGAIGYVTMGLLTLDGHGIDQANGLRAVPLNGMLPTAGSVADSRYPLSAPIVFFGPTAPGNDAYRDFFAWVQSAAGQAIVGKYYAPLKAG